MRLHNPISSSSHVPRVAAPNDLIFVLFLLIFRDQRKGVDQGTKYSEPTSMHTNTVQCPVPSQVYYSSSDRFILR